MKDTEVNRNPTTETSYEKIEAATLDEQARPDAHPPDDHGNKSQAEAVRPSKEFIQSLTEKVGDVSFEQGGMTGAEIFVKLCKEDLLAALFFGAGKLLRHTRYRDVRYSELRRAY